MSICCTRNAAQARLNSSQRRPGDQESWLGRAYGIHTLGGNIGWAAAPLIVLGGFLSTIYQRDPAYLEERVAALAFQHWADSQRKVCICEQLGRQHDRSDRGPRS